MRRIIDVYRRSFTGLPRAAWVLAAVSLVNRSGNMVLPFLALYLTKERGYSTAAAGAVQAVYGAGSLAGAWVGGILTDRYGPRRVQIGSLLANGVGLVVLGAMRSFGGIVATTALVSLASEGFRPANAAAVASSSPPHVTSRAFALNRMAVNMGMTLGAVVGGLLAERGYAWLFLVDGITSCLAALLLIRSRPPERIGAGAPGSAAAISPYRDRFFVAAWVLIVLLATVFFQLHTTFMLYLSQAYRLSEASIGALLAINTVLVVLLEVVVVHRLEKKEPLGIVAAGAALLCVGFALLPYGRSPAWAAATIVIWTAGEIVSFAFLSTFVARRAGAASQGRYMAAYVMAFGLAFVVAPLAGSNVYQTLGPDWVWHGCGLIGIVLLAGFGWLAAAGRRSLAGDGHDQ